MQLIVVLPLLLYFSIVLLPKVWPWFGESAIFFTYIASLCLVLGLLLLAGVWSTISLIFSGMLREEIRSRYRLLVTYSVFGYVIFGLVLGLNRIIPSPLPSGSHQMEFNAAVWTRPDSSSFIKGDITPRQKMLGDVIAMLPGKTKSEIEVLLGPSLETQYFVSTGRDMIYVLGPERRYLALDSEWLLIWLDKNSRFLRYTIVND